MSRILDHIKILLGFLICSPHVIMMLLSKQKSAILSDTEKWLEVREHKFKPVPGFVFLLQTYREFRSLFYYRMGNLKYLVKWYCPERRNMVIGTDHIEGGLYIHLGYSTVIGAESIGKNCMIYQQVTIGSFAGKPIIGDNVTIASGAVIIGRVKIGNNVHIAANVTIMRNIPDNTTVYPPKPIMMKWSQGKGDKAEKET